MYFLIDLILLIGRILFAFVFVYLGIDRLLHWNRSIEFFKDVPLNTATFLVIIGLILQFFGAFTLFFGVKTRLGALALLIYVIAMSVWPVSSLTFIQAGHENELITFLQQALAVAGLLYVLAIGPGRISCDWLCSRRTQKTPPPNLTKET